jgi:hypothetical protein
LVGVAGQGDAVILNGETVVFHDNLNDGRAPVGQPTLKRITVQCTALKALK